MSDIPVFSITAVDFSRVHAAEIQAELRRLARKTGNLVMDLGSVSYVDSVALTLLHSVDELCQEQGGKLVLAGVHPGVVRVFETMGLEIQLSVSVDAALEQLSGES
ncbi:MAG: STAS domain-containing protein [bacterium]|nr:STAS domain-containing protein [bacterium]